MNTILILKPIIDALYEEMRQYQERTDKRIQWLEGQLAQYKNKESYEIFIKEMKNTDDVNDDDYAEAALAPPAAVVQVENKTEVRENTSTTQEDTKTVRMIGGKDAKEYMKEYQRSYRKKQKENAQKV